MNYPHVTSILSILRKPGLENWYKTNSAEFCNAESEKGKTIGTLIHKVIQNHIEKEKIEFETEYPDEVNNALKSFFKFKKEHPEFELKKAELSIVNEKYRYCGHLDCLAKEKNKPVILDYKTGKAKENDSPIIYPESIYQISAYVKAYNNINLKGNVDRAYILSLAKDKIAYGLLLISKEVLDEVFNEVFLPCLKIWQYQNAEGGQNGLNTRSRTRADSKGSRKFGRESDKLPDSF